MSANNLDAVLEAAQSLMDFVEQAKKTQAAFARASMSLPEEVRRVFSNGMKESVVPVQIAPLERPTLPADAEADWICIDARRTAATNVLLAILRDAAGVPVRHKTLVAAVREILPEVNSGTIANIGSRLEKAKVIDRKEDGWILKRPERAGILADGHFWAPPKICTVHELASHRRDAILHVLKQFTSGLQALQLLEQLRNCSSWMHAPLNKDLLKEDIEVLKAEGKIKRRGNTTKLEIVEPKPNRIGGIEMGTVKMGT